MIKGLFLVIMMTAAGVPAYAEEAKAPNDDFISSTISDVFDKLGKYTVGEKDIFYSKDENKDKDKDADYERDALGRKVPRATLKTGREAALNQPL